jgi:hypothetical protein|tara:strand:+ start:2205 stop:2444 length:240 start_codon:yes stop_codon:yes gene_type:complete
VAANLTLTQMKTLRDNLVTAYTTLSDNPTKQYLLGDRNFIYEDRASIWKEIGHLTRLICLLDPTEKAKGSNRADLRYWS